MPLSIRVSIVLLAAGALAACSGSTTSPTTPTAPSGPVTNEVFAGTVSPPSSGALQSASNPFTVAVGNSSISVTLTSAVETLPDGTLLPTVTMGLGLGTWSNGACTLEPNTFTTAQGGSVAQISGTISAGSYCVSVSDVTNQLGPVAYAVAIAHY
jgi:ABC-type glycerol-3-phosphate transport system substrate-binding protein